MTPAQQLKTLEKLQHNARIEYTELWMVDKKHVVEPIRDKTVFQVMEVL